MKCPFPTYLSRSTVLMLVLGSAIAWLPSPGMAQNYSTPITLYAFSGPDGQYPAIALTADGQGNFYGVTALGGPSFSFLNGGNDAFGTIFKYSTTTGALTTLASFDGLNGFKPLTSVTIDSHGNLWGTTYQGGVDWNPPVNHFGWGTVWKYSPAGLFVPGMVEFSGPDGANAIGNLAFDSQGNLWGATYQGGFGWNPTLGSFGSGSLFQLPPGLVRTSPAVFIEGALPISGPIFDSLGNIFGIMSQGGLTGQGSLYEFSAAGLVTSPVSFTGPNGITPGTIVMDRTGNLYGTTGQGGAFNFGTLWKYSASGGLTTLVNFNGTNGQFAANLTVDSNGNVFGATGNGGVNGGGILFEYSTSGVLSTLFDFNTTNNGAFPTAILFDSQGNIYGTTEQGGSTGRGTIYTMRPIGTSLKVSSISVGPTSLQGGGTAQGTVTLNGPAPSGGIPVVLGSNSSFATPVGPVTVRAGATSATFNIVTEPVAQATTVQISAILGGNSLQTPLTLTPPPAVTLVRIGLNPDLVQGGTSSTGTVTLNEVASSSGTVVALSSDTPSAASVPSSVTVPAGATSANFNITTQTVSANTFVTITATLGATSLQATIGVLNLPAIIVGDLSISPTNVSGGSPTTGVVSLSRQAPPGGIAVTLSSNTGVAGVPGTVTVPAGYIRTPFTITTVSVNTSSTATITASLNGGSLQTQFTVTPASSVTLSSFTLSQPGLSVPNGSASSVTGGFSSQGTVNLTGPAPTGDVVVTISSSSGLASMPPGVSITAGNTTTSFAINTQPVTSNTSVVITVTAGGNSQHATLTIAPPQAAIAIASFTLNPASVTGGSTSQATVTLNGPAPSGGTAVTFTSNNPAASVTPSIIMPAGSTTATVPITTQSVTATTTAIVSAGTNNGSVQATLTITPPTTPPITVSSLTLNPASVQGGGTSQGTVTLNTAAPAGGTAVSLSSSASAATVPSSVTVPAGSTSASFTVNTQTVTTTSSAVITATAGSSSRQATLTITPAGAVTLSSLTLNPTSVIGGGSSQGKVTLTGPAGTGGAVVTLSSNSGAAGAPASVTVPAGNTTASFAVTTQTVTSLATVVITATLGGSSQQATLTITPATAVTLSSLTLNPTSVRGGNTSQGTVTLSGQAPSGGAVVTLSSNKTSVATTPASVTVAAGSTSATFTVSTTRPSSTTTVTISAVYNGATKTASLTVTRR
jgi:trimeric autotransporter adhesin